MELKFRAWDTQFHRMKVTGMGINNGILIGEEVEIMQFTGIKDKNGKEIYEGDIAGCDCLDDMRRAVVERHSHGLAAFVFRYLKLIWCDYDFDYVGMKECEVIGNIYENPELLETNQGEL